jgi:hypothetical protein
MITVKQSLEIHETFIGKFEGLMGIKGLSGLESA